MVFYRKKTIGGRQYLYLVENKRVDGKCKVARQIYIGPANKLLEIIEKQKDIPTLLLKTFDFGKFAAAVKVAEELHFSEIIKQTVRKKKGFDAGQLLLLIILGRFDGPLSKSKIAKLYSKTILPYWFELPKKLGVGNLLRQMDYLNDSIIKKMSESFSKVLLEKGISPTLLILDSTNVFTYIEKGEKLPQKGYSKERRHDKNIVNIAVSVSEHNIPFLHETYEGDKHEAKIFPELVDKITERLVALGIDAKGVVLVFDKGNNSEDNIAKVVEDMHFVASAKKNQLPHLLDIPPEKFSFLYKNHKGHEIMGHRTKEVLFDREFTVVISFNESSYKRQLGTYLAKKEKIMEKLNLLKESIERGKGRGRRLTIQGAWIRIGETIPKNLRKVFRVNIRERKMEWEINKKAEEYLMKSFGKCILFTDLDDWDTKRIVKAYNSKHLLEHDFKMMKNNFFLPIKPVYHRLDKRVKVHVFLYLLGTLFFRYLMWKVRRMKLSDYEVLDALSDIKLSLIQHKESKKLKWVINEMDGLSAELFSQLELTSLIPK